MPVEQDFLIVAGAAGALVDSQANYDGAGYQTDGFQPGITLPAQFNKTLRQGSTGMAVIGGLIAQVLNQPVIDNGEAGLATLITQLIDAIQSLANAAGSPRVVTLAFSATPVFDCTQANPLISVFEMTLTGNVTSSTFNGLQAGQIVILNLFEDVAGGHTFVPPAGLPMNGMGSTNPSAKTTQAFLYLGPGVWIPLTPLMTN